jgi:HEAT repeat protein
MARVPILLALVAPLVSAASAQDGGDTVLSVRMEWEPGPLGSAGGTPVRLSPDPPAGLEPPPGAKQPRFAAHPLGDVDVLRIAVDVAPGRERIWIDRNFDGDLADGGAIDWELQGSAFRCSETVLVPYSTERLPVPVEIELWSTDGGAGGTLSLAARMHKVGRIEIGDQLRDLGLQDDRHQLRFDQESGPVLVIDMDGDGLLQAAHGTPEHFHAGDPLRFGDTGWTFRVTDAAGSAVEFQRMDAPPPAPEPAWRELRPPPSPYRPQPPPEAFELLAERIDAERGQIWTQRQAAVRAVGQLGTDDAFDLLLELAKEDRDPQVRRAAVGAMGNAAFLEGHGDVLLRLAKGKDEELAAAAVPALHQMGHPDRAEVYRDLLRSRDAASASAAAQYLAYLGLPEDEAALDRILEDHDDGSARRAAYVGLRSRPGGPGAERMVRAARDPYPALRSLGLADLEAMGRPEARQLAVEAVRSGAAAGILGQPVVRILVDAGDRDAAEALITLAAQAPPALRQQVTNRLATLRSDGAVAALLEALGSREETVRRVAAPALAGVVRPEVSAALVRRLRSEKDDEVRLQLLEALGEQGDPGATAALLRATRKRGAERWAALRSLARIGFGQPEARAYLVGCLGSRSWEDRVVAVDAAGISGEVQLGDELLPLLEDPRWEVRLATAEALRHLRAAEWIEPLVRRTSVEENTRVRAAMFQSLFDITGLSIPDSPETWTRWWEEQGAGFEIPEVVQPRPMTVSGATAASFYGLPLRSERLVFVIDQSGSMSARDTTASEEDTGPRRTRLEQAVVETLNAVRSLDASAQVNVIFFESGIHPWKESVTKLGRKNREDLEQYLGRQRPMGGTNLFDGLELALQDAEVDTVVLLSDGSPGAGRYVSTEDILRAVGRVNQTRRIAIHCVSLGRDSELLRRLAAENGGRYVRR